VGGRVAGRHRVQLGVPLLGVPRSLPPDGVEDPGRVLLGLVELEAEVAEVHLAAAVGGHVHRRDRVDLLTGRQDRCLAEAGAGKAVVVGHVVRDRVGGGAVDGLAGHGYLSEIGTLRPISSP